MVLQRVGQVLRLSRLSECLPCTGLIGANRVFQQPMQRNPLTCLGTESAGAWCWNPAATSRPLPRAIFLDDGRSAAFLRRRALCRCSRMRQLRRVPSNSASSWNLRMCAPLQRQRQKRRRLPDAQHG